MVTNNYTPCAGGIVSSIKALTKGLRELGYTVVIVTLDLTPQKNLIEQNVILSYCPLRFHYYNNIMAIPWRPYAQLLKIIKQLNPDVIHAHHPFLLGPLAAKIAKEHNIPLLFTYHTQYEAYAHYLACPTRITKPIITSLVKKFCNKTSAIIAPSKSIKDLLEKGDIKKPIHILPSCIEELFFAQNHHDLTTKESFHIITVSRFAQEKNITFLLDVFAQLPKNRFIFTLIGYGPQKEYLMHYAYTTLALDQRQVRFVEKPPKAFIKEHYDQADVFIFASTTETQGIVLAEAMACSTPVIALDGPGTRDIITSGYNGSIVYNQKEMVNAIMLLEQNPVLLEKYKNNAATHAQQYRASHICSAFEAILTTLQPPSITFNQLPSCLTIKENR